MKRIALENIYQTIQEANLNWMAKDKISSKFDFRILKSNETNYATYLDSPSLSKFFETVLGYNKFYATSNFRIIRTLNGFIILNHSLGRSAKFLDSRYEPNFVANELFANKLVPKHSLEVFSHGKTQNYSFVVQELITGYQALDWENWKSYHSRAIELLISTKVHAESIGSGEYIQQLEQRTTSTLETAPMYEKNLVSRSADNFRTILRMLSSIQLSSKTILRSHAHGDLTPNNIFATQDRFIIFDWANGGNLNHLYDFVLPLIYFPDSFIWNNFESNLILNKSLFDSQTKLYTESVKRLGDISVDDNYLKFNILSCLIEFGLKNFERYKSQDDFKGLEWTIGLLAEILKKIEKNRTI